MLFVLLLACAGRPADRLVVVGMDGLDRRMVERLEGQGDLPHMARVAREGLVADMHPTHPMLSPIIWTTIASGYPGEVHGVGGWTSASGHSYSAADVRVMRIWDVASRYDVPVLVAGWLMSWPSSPVDGEIVSDRFVWSFPMNKSPDDPSIPISKRQHDDLVGLTWPADLADRAASWIPDQDWLDNSPLAYQVHEYDTPFHPVVRDETQVRAFEALWDPAAGAARPRLALIYLQGADPVSHLYWPFADPEVRAELRRDPTARMRAAAADRARASGRRPYPWTDAPITADEIADGARWVPDYYRWLDAALGRIMERIDPATTTLIVCSDHGFRTAGIHGVLNGGHRDPAILMAWGKHVRAGAKGELSVLDLGPTLYALAGLPAARDMPGELRTDLFDVEPVPPVDTWVLPRVVVEPGGAKTPSEKRLLEQLEALGYVDEQGAPILGASRRRARHRIPQVRRTRRSHSLSGDP